MLRYRAVYRFQTLRPFLLVNPYSKPLRVRSFQQEDSEEQRFYWPARVSVSGLPMAFSLGEVASKANGTGLVQQKVGRSSDMWSVSYSSFIIMELKIYLLIK